MAAIFIRAHALSRCSGVLTCEVVVEQVEQVRPGRSSQRCIMMVRALTQRCNGCLQQSVTHADNITPDVCTKLKYQPTNAHQCRASAPVCFANITQELRVHRCSGASHVTSIAHHMDDRSTRESLHANNRVRHGVGSQYASYSEQAMCPGELVPLR